MKKMRVRVTLPDGVPINYAIVDTLTEVLPELAKQLLDDARTKMGKGIVPPQLVNQMAGRMAAQASGYALGYELAESARGQPHYEEYLAAIYQCSHDAAVWLSDPKNISHFGPLVGMLVTVVHGVQLYCMDNLPDDPDDKSQD